MLLEIDKARIRLADGVRLIRLTSCSYCKKFASECKCGRPLLYANR